MLSVLMTLRDAALPQRVGGATYYTDGAITPTGASRGSGSSNSWSPHGADRAALPYEKARGEVARTREHDGGVHRPSGGDEKGPRLRYRRRDLNINIRLSPEPGRAPHQFGTIQGLAGRAAVG
jgi:hypothetical protein